MVADRVASAPSGPIEPMVKIHGLVKLYGGERALKGVDLDVRPGEIYGLIGPDGAGKSSLLKAVAGVMSFDGGLVDVLGIRVDSENSAERIKDRIGFMPQGLGQNLYHELSVEENIDFFAGSRLVRAEHARERKGRLLEMTRLSPFRHRLVKDLSGGMKQKLGLICTLIHEPRLVILDEPTTGVDPVSRRDFWGILGLLLRERTLTALVSTAYMDEASRFHRLSLFFDGRIVARGAPDEVVAAVPGSLVELKSERQAEVLAGLRVRFPEAEARGSRVRVFIKKEEEPKAAKLVREALVDMGAEATMLRAGIPELEDVFIALLKEKKLLREDLGMQAYPPPDEAVQPVAEEPPGGEAAVRAENLVRDFGGFRAVDGVSFRLERGEIFGLLGANGAGKTTIIKMLVGLLKPSGGRGYIAGKSMAVSSRAIRERIGYMSQVFTLYPDLTVVENIRLYAGIYGLDRRQAKNRTDWIIEMAELAGHEVQLAGTLPVGIRQKLALGCALVHRPPILFLDEPTSGVDPVGRRRFWDILFRLSRGEGVTILITTHYMSEAEHCDHLALMYAGRIVADASPGEMKRELEAEAGQLLEVSTEKPLDALEALKKAGFDGVALHGRQIHLLARDREAAERRIEAALAGAGIKFLSLSEQPLSMEDVFVYRVFALEKLENGLRFAV
jgi:ABC-type multidrug transport system ATPase subunit